LSVSDADVSQRAQFGHSAGHFVGDQVKAARARAQGDLILNPHRERES
jgi:hypothetical protein